MQISITAGIPGNESQRKHSENTKNPEKTKEWLDTDLGVLGLRSQVITETYWGTRVHGTGNSSDMNNTDKQEQADDENNKYTKT